MLSPKTPVHKLRLLKDFHQILMGSVAECEIILQKSRDHVSLNSRNQVAQRCLLDLLQLVDARVTTSGAPVTKVPSLFVGNHTSYLDVPVLYSQTSVSFVARHDLRYWPVIGRASQSIDTIYIKRGREGSRKEAVKEAIVQNIREGRSVGIFPEGTTSVTGTPWKLGALALAQEHKIPVQPFRIRYHPERACAYIDKDSFVTHLWKLFDAGPIHIECEFREPMIINDFAADTRDLQKWSREKPNN